MRVLEALEAQTLPTSRWELHLVDNASNEPLAQLYDLSWHANGRHLLEPDLGLSSARCCGIREARGQTLVFVDDDNVLHPSYLAEALKIGLEWPLLGVWGSGMVVGEFERDPPEPLKRFLPYLAIRDAKVRRWGNVLPCGDSTPWGAGLCVRANVANGYIQMCKESALPITGRRGKALLAGEDLEVSYVACSMGLGMGVFPELILTHLIPEQRLREDYLVSLIEGVTLSEILVAYKWRGTIPVSWWSIRNILSLLKNVLFSTGTDRRLYLAKRRATIQAKRIIADHLKQTSPEATVHIHPQRHAAPTLGEERSSRCSVRHE